ncbi:MAG: type II toxin-antitoxin system HicB family antitoxin [Candidatus Aminicenantes bacterium]|nr:type II toxin-antitoxin system HicB family antitoxin [Candidatus Aminicenantes bacterium]
MCQKTFQPTAVFKKDEKNGGYFVFCPTVEGVFSQGETIEEAREMIKDALEGVIEAALEEDIENYFNTDEYIPKRNEIVEPININKKLQVAVSIRIARERHGYTQRQLARKIGIKQQHISRYEKGVVVPSADRFLELLEA